MTEALFQILAVRLNSVGGGMCEQFRSVLLVNFYCFLFLGSGEQCSPDVFCIKYDVFDGIIYVLFILPAAIKAICYCVLVNRKEGNAFVFFWYIELRSPNIYLKMTNYSNFCRNWIHGYDFMQKFILKVIYNKKISQNIALG